MEKTRRGMDVISILKELSMLRVLIAALLTRQQTRLTPWVDLSLSSTEEQREAEIEDPKLSESQDMMSLGNMLTAARRLTTISKEAQDGLRGFSVVEGEQPQEQFEARPAGETLWLGSPIQPLDPWKFGDSDKISVVVRSGIHVSVDQFISTNLKHLIHTLSTQTTPSTRAEEGNRASRYSEGLSLVDSSFISFSHQHEDDSKDQNTLLKNQL